MMRTPLIGLLATLSLFLIGCASGTGANSASNLAAQETVIRISSALATKAALVATDTNSVSTVAISLNTVAKKVVAATNNQATAVFMIQTMAVDAINADQSLNPQQRLLASQLVDTVGILVQAYVENNSSAAADTTVVRAYIQSAALGVADATAMFVPTPPTSLPASRS